MSNLSDDDLTARWPVVRYQLRPGARAHDLARVKDIGAAIALRDWYRSEGKVWRVWVAHV